MAVSRNNLEERVLVLMPTRRDAERTVELLEEAKVTAVPCNQLSELCRELRAGAGALMLTDDAILSDPSGQLAEAVRSQPPWSAVPIVVLAREGFGPHLYPRVSATLNQVLVVERPVRTRTLVSVVMSALRARMQQYEIRDAILERERQASELNAQDERLRFALSAGRLGAFDLDLVSNELECSEIFKEHVGRAGDGPLSFDSVLGDVHPDDKARVSEAFEQSRRNGLDYDIVYRACWPSDQVRWLMVRARVQHDRLGRPSRLVGVSLDVTEQRSMHEKLEQSQAELARQADQLRTADKAKDEFLATLAHELRNPLAPLRTGLDLLNASADRGEERTLAVMQRQLDHMVRLIDDLLDVSRITRGKLELKRERLTLAQVIDAAVESSRPFVQRSRHTLRVSVDDPSLCFVADFTRIAQVITNLLNNSSKYTPPGGNIELTARKEDASLVVEVSDDGIGIPPDRLDEVFEMFSQVNRTLDRSQAGLGIGLALVRKLVRLHGGTVSATSEGPGMGATFTVRLPLERAEAQPLANAQVVRAPDERRILIVDDNDDAADLLSMMLEKAGHRTKTACDGVSALETAALWSPDVIVLDIGLPGMSGYDVARTLRSDQRFSHTALIALTGWGTEEDKHEAMEAGFNAHLTKPVNANDLYGALVRADEVERRARASEPNRNR
jgi:signal transduction histidine kinase/DNA-binding response OmpR family regulator